MRSDVAVASGDVPGVIWMTSVPCAAASGVTLATSEISGRPASSVLSAAASAGELVWATRMSGPLKPGQQVICLPGGARLRVVALVGRAQPEAQHRDSE